MYSTFVYISVHFFASSSLTQVVHATNLCFVRCVLRQACLAERLDYDLFCATVLYIHA